MSNAYSAIGGVFEYLNDDCGYDKWSQYLINTLKNLGVPYGARGVDAGCGNGYFTRALFKAGYGVIGADISPEMLSKAKELSLKEGLKTQYISGDITSLTLNFKPDFITAVNDCFNYIPQNKLFSAFSKLYRLLKRGGALIFDISSEHKLRDIIGSNVFAEDREDVSYTWFNTLKDDRVEMDITVFLRRADGLYERRDEAQTQYIHGETEIVSLLERVGFTVKTEGHLGGDKSERINFICIKE
ncbi:MAG: class I SAM-dependent methyltransferase [Clostridia bacterium]|nr:class I SAM-dependent methyltransferase [Clostridia bacterium]